MRNFCWPREILSSNFSYKIVFCFLFVLLGNSVWGNENHIITPNDVYYPEQWALHANKTSPEITRVWEIESGDPHVIVAIIDMGFDFSHEDLKDNIWQNPKEIKNNGIDDDGNGFIDDIIGWDFVDQVDGLDDPGNDCSDEDNDPSFLLSSHGNCVLSVVGAVANNGIGVAGVANRCKFMLIRAGYLNKEGESVLNHLFICKGIRYATDNGARVINISSGCEEARTEYKKTLEYAVSKGVVIVCSAGNHNSNIPIYPAAYYLPGVISVGATDNLDRKAWFSNYGSWVDVSAPGEKITTAINGNKYGKTQGTSFAAPFVAGVAALLVTQHPDWSAEKIHKQIVETADVIPALADANFSSSRINAYRALTEIPKKPSPQKPKKITPKTFAQTVQIAKTQELKKIKHTYAILIILISFLIFLMLTKK